MKLNNTIIDIFKIVSLSPLVKRQLISTDHSIIINNLISINLNSMILCNKYDIYEKINTDNHKNVVPEFPNDKIIHFLEKLTQSVTRLNHIGISYSCFDIHQELSLYKNIIDSSENNIYEEVSGDKKSHWFFIGNTIIWENPLFEIVLTQSGERVTNDWLPHFQIDLDTKLSYKEIMKISKNYFGQNLFKWNLDIPNYGIVLTMGKLMEINQTKIYLGVGTDVRDTKYHREKILKEV